MVYDNGVENLIVVELVEYKHDPKIYNKILKLLKEKRTKILEGDI